MGNIPNDFELMQCSIDQSQLDRIEAMLIELTKKKNHKPKPKPSNVLYASGFQAMWADDYPKRAGNNPKLETFDAFSARMKEGSTMKELRDGVLRYAGYCDATGKTGTEYVMQARTFFGPSKPYEQDWTIPDTVKKSEIPRDDEEMQRWAVKKGLRAARQGESWGQYRAYVTGEV